MSAAVHREPTSPSVWLMTFYGCGLLAFGTLNTLTMKGQFMMSSIGIGGRPEQFSKPWFATFIVFFACTLVFTQDLAAWVFALVGKNKVTNGSQPLLADHSPKVVPSADPVECPDVEKSYWSKVAIVAVPATIDVLATSFGCIGLLFVPASVFQMLRGSMIIFAAIMAVSCLGRKLLRFHWLGVALCVLGVALVGVAASSGSNASSQGRSPADVALGIGLILIGQVLQAAQMVLEEWLLKTVGLSGMHIIGWEGAWGCIVILAIAFPSVNILSGADHGHVEDLTDTFVMLQNNMVLLGLVVTYTISCCFYNVFGISVTGALTAVHRTMLEASRSLLVWLVALIVHYCVDSHSGFGEAWTIYSCLQLAGFCCLIFGQAVYGEVVRIPGMHYPVVDEVEVEEFRSPLAEEWLTPGQPKRQVSGDGSDVVNLL